MKKLLWFSPRDEKPAIELILSVDSAQWLADHLPRDDSARDQLVRAILEASRQATPE